MLCIPRGACALLWLCQPGLELHLPRAGSAGRCEPALQLTHVPGEGRCCELEWTWGVEAAEEDH